MPEIIDYNDLFRAPYDPTPQDAIDCLIETSGNLNLAAERLCRKTNQALGSITPQQVQALVTEDMPQLQKRIKADLLVQLYSTMQSSIAAMVAALPLLGPSDAIRAANQLTAQLAALSDDKSSTHTINVNEYAWQHIKPQVKELMIALALADEQGHLLEPPS